jgi:ATP-dependent Clp protease ATP-binding subunit ClpC
MAAYSCLSSLLSGQGNLGMNELNLNSLRARKARLSSRIGKVGFEAMVGLVWLFGLGSIYFFIADRPSPSRLGFLFLGLSLLSFMLAIWDRWDLQRLAPTKVPKTLDEIIEPRLLASFGKRKDLSSQDAWKAAIKNWEARFLSNHLLLDNGLIAQTLPAESAQMQSVWQTAQDLMASAQSRELNSGALAAALILSSPATKDFLAKLNLQVDDVKEVYTWVARVSNSIKHANPYFGGIGRDWATGYTPTLDRFGANISREVEAGGAHFHTLAHSDILDSIIHNLNSGAVGIVGEAGVGKTSLVYALAQRLLEGYDENLRYYQIVSLDASAIMSSAKDELEKIILTLFAEAAHARNIIIFLDEAQLFFGTGIGAFNISQVLLPLIQNQKVRLIAALAPDDFQTLKSQNPELIAHLPTVIVTEPEQPVVKKVLEDTALTFEARNNILISYQAIEEALRLSGQFMEELAYPGKAINLLEQAVPYIEGKLMTANSIQQAVEKTRGVRVSKAQAPEADILLHLEDRIHERMVNQERAVKVIAAALRRGRAGVSDPNRPIGSFLFLGPTGVGKTELARSLAATYFGDERQMIRLDMSEYQQADDVQRLLETGGSASKSLILQIREQPFSVVLLDEVEKAHTNILNLLLQLLDEGQLTDEKGHATSFKNAIIISTSNAGAVEITQRVGAGDSLESFERPLIEKLINEGQFKPELINRFDEIVLFRPLNMAELSQVASIMLGGVNKTLSNQNISVQLTPEALQKVVEAGYDPEFGARPMRRALQKMVEDAIAKKVLSDEAQPGSVITLGVNDLSA